MPASLKLFVDLGDIFTKALALGDGHAKYVRFPSVVAHDLIDGDAAADRLLLYDEDSLPRPAGFDPSRHDRLDSYPGKKKALETARARGHPASGARFAGKLAVLYGADRVTLGKNASEEAVDALVRKALLKTASGYQKVDITFVVDGGPKAAAIERYAASLRTVEMLRWTFKRKEPEPMRLEVRSSLVDAAECARWALPAGLELERRGRVLVADVGYERTKLALLTPEGCEGQAELSTLGVSDCVRRVLRDGQDQGLVEDEFAIIWALERSRSTIQVAGGRFDVSAPLRDAEGALVAELGKGIEAHLLSQYERRAHMCRAVALMGGGAAALGAKLEAHLMRLELGLDAIASVAEPGFALIEGARRRAGLSPSSSSTS